MTDDSDKQSFVDKMKDALFEKHKEREDGMVEAEVTDEVYDMIMENVPQDEPLTPVQFNTLLIEVSIEIANYLLGEIEDLPPKLASSFSFDFVSQLLMAAASVSVNDSKFDPMFG